jgi:hypothetical protein
MRKISLQPPPLVLRGGAGVGVIFRLVGGTCQPFTCRRERFDGLRPIRRYLGFPIGFEHFWGGGVGL